MEPQITDRPDRSRFEVLVDGTTAGFAEYHLSEDEIAFIHTEIGPEYAGQGLAGLLARRALNEVRGRSLAVLPYCPFIRGWIGKHPEYTDLVPADRRERFGL